MLLLVLLVLLLLLLLLLLVLLLLVLLLLLLEVCVGTEAWRARPPALCRITIGCDERHVARRAAEGRCIPVSVVMAVKVAVGFVMHVVLGPEG